LGLAWAIHRRMDGMSTTPHDAIARLDETPIPDSTVTGGSGGYGGSIQRSNGCGVSIGTLASARVGVPIGRLRWWPVRGASTGAPRRWDSDPDAPDGACMGGVIRSHLAVHKALASGIYTDVTRQWNLRRRCLCRKSNQNTIALAIQKLVKYSMFLLKKDQQVQGR
jgi:hypothetical protein